MFKIRLAFSKPLSSLCRRYCDFDPK